MNIALEPQSIISIDPTIHRHLTLAERLSLRLTLWLLERHLRRNAARERQHLRRHYEAQEARACRQRQIEALADWHLNAR
ncbi:hypothetical protein GCM10009808_05320 [Microbacterium sediminicola]|uniref:Uncharacterized protein n=1 Tax=Microbacterium sediminicola TaxID=415210 RepID=A0ABP4TPS2_9MICO